MTDIIPTTKAKVWSVEGNILHLECECGRVEDTEFRPDATEHGGCMGPQWVPGIAAKDIQWTQCGSCDRKMIP